jgi:hypothetical protein
MYRTSRSRRKALMSIDCCEGIAAAACGHQDGCHQLTAVSPQLSQYRPVQILGIATKLAERLHASPNTRRVITMQQGQISYAARPAT